MAKWTKGEITLLSKNYGKKTVLHIATLVGRSEAAVGMYLAKHRAEFPRIRVWDTPKTSKKTSKKVNSTKKVAKKSKKTLTTTNPTPTL